MRRIKSGKIDMMKTTRLSLEALLALVTSILLCVTVCSACKTRLVALPSDKIVTLLEPGQRFTNGQEAVYLVPEARMQEILQALGDKAQ